MNEKPILFNAEMVRAVLAGNKTQTRRLVKPQPPVDAYVNFAIDRAVFWVPATFVSESQLPLYDKEIMTPWAVDDLLWVRETWLEFNHFHRPPRFAYRADITDQEQEEIRLEYGYKWRPSIHMPRWASRLTLRVKRVWVERVQDISIQDAYAEGVYCVMEQRTNCFAPGVQGKYPTQECAFRALWDSIYAAKGYSWDTNPYVWVCEFEVSNE